MPSADKRARQKENARPRREQREAAEKRRKRIRSTTTIAIVGAVFVGLVVLLNVAGNDKKKATPPASTTTTLPANLNGCSTAAPPKGAQQSFSKPDLPTFDANKTYVATVSTSCGTFKITLDTKNAPKGAGNFAFLADKSFYNGLKFNRAADNFVIQVGDYEGDTSGGSGYTITTETPADGFKLGSVGWAKGGGDPAGSAGSQFFVVTGNSLTALNQKVDGKVQYGEFGKVTSGLDVAQKIMSFHPPDTGDGALTQPVYIKKVTVSAS